jgi:hypothetical protein
MKRIKSRIIVELDDAASKLLRAHMAEEPGDDPRDVVSAAVVFMLSDPEDDDGEFASDDALEHARERRLALEGKGDA